MFKVRRVYLFAIGPIVGAVIGSFVNSSQCERSERVNFCPWKIPVPSWKHSLCAWTYYPYYAFLFAGSILYHLYFLVEMIFLFCLVAYFKQQNGCVNLYFWILSANRWILFYSRFTHIIRFNNGRAFLSCRCSRGAILSMVAVRPYFYTSRFEVGLNGFGKRKFSAWGMFIFSSFEALIFTSQNSLYRTPFLLSY